jgi:HAD superfamily hydrolase (TIGR01509 family)
MEEQAPGPFQALILDFDGLMVDSERFYHAVTHEQVLRYGKPVMEEDFRQMMGRAPLEAAAILIERLALPVSPEAFVAEREVSLAAWFATDLETMPGLFELLDRFAGRLVFAIASGSPSRLLLPVLQRFGIAGRFSIVQTSDDVAHGKPDPELFLRAVARLGLPAHACLVLEDSGNGVEAAVRAGCPVLAVPNVDTRNHDFSKATAVVKDLFGAADWIADSRLV